jgi:hypothetical protein
MLFIPLPPFHLLFNLLQGYLYILLDTGFGSFHAPGLLVRLLIQYLNNETMLSIGINSIKLQTYLVPDLVRSVVDESKHISLSETNASSFVNYHGNVVCSTRLLQRSSSPPAIVR